MNGVEWHKSSEVVIAATDCVLILGDVKDIRDDVYDSARAIALFLRKGEAVELFAGTLHLAPLATDDKFAAAIVCRAAPTRRSKAEFAERCAQSTNGCWFTPKTKRVYDSEEKSVLRVQT